MAIKERELAQRMSHAEPNAPSPLAELIDKPVAPPAVAYPSVVLGVCKHLDEQGVLKVAFPGSAGDVTARLAVALNPTRIQRAIDSQQSVMLALENDDVSRPIVLGLVESTVPKVATAEDSAARVIECDVDGKRVRVVGEDEIVLQCGLASITLRRNGRVLIRGTHVETYSEGTNRIKGGQVRIN